LTNIGRYGKHFLDSVVDILQNKIRIKNMREKAFSFYTEENKSFTALHILNIIRKNAPISRIDIARISGLSAATVTKFVNRLIDSGFLKEDGYYHSRGGRRPVLLRLEPSSGFAVGVDLGGENLRVAVVNMEADPVWKVSLLTQAEQGREKVFQRLTNTISEVLEKTDIPRDKIKGIGIGISGLIDSQKGVSLFCPNLPGWENVPLKKMIEDEFGLPCVVDDSSRAMALAEHWCGAAQDVDDFILVNVGVGVGCGIFTHGRLYRGVGGIAGEFGHMTIKEKGPRCNCGNRGCLETLASGPAIARRAREALDEGVVSEIRKLCGNNLAAITPPMIVEAAKKGDKLAFNLIEKTGEYLGIGIANLINIFNPELVVIGAGISRAGDLLLEPLKRTVRARALQQAYRMVEIKKSSLDEFGGAIGGAILILRNIFEYSE